MDILYIIIGRWKNRLWWISWLQHVTKFTFTDWIMNKELAALWCKRLNAHFPPLGSQVRVSVTRWGMKWDLDRFLSAFLPFSPTTNFIPRFLHVHPIHFVSFHFISPCNGATGMVSQHPWYSLTCNIRASLNLIPQSSSVLDTSWGC